MAKRWGKAEPLVAAHIKGVSFAAIQQHPETFDEFIGHGKSGIYVLRKDRDVYYVGLAGSLRKRLPAHLNDHLRGKWNWFDLYIIKKTKVKYLRDLESLPIRVSKPPGNKTEPHFICHKNITKQFKKALEHEIGSFFIPSD